MQVKCFECCELEDVESLVNDFIKENLLNEDKEKVSYIKDIDIKPFTYSDEEGLDCVNYIGIIKYEVC